MKWLAVESSNIKRVGFDLKSKRMRIEFHHGGTYEYHPVSRKTYEEIVNAKSVGGKFNELVKYNSAYQWEKLR